MADFSPSKAFSDFFFLAIDHGFDSIEGDGCPLVPFTMAVDSSGKRLLSRFATDRLEDGLEKAKSSIKDSDSLSMYAIAWDGFVTIEGRKWDAILVEAGEASEDSGVLFAQRYILGPKRLFRGRRCERVGNPALIGRPHSRLRAGDA